MLAVLLTAAPCPDGNARAQGGLILDELQRREDELARALIERQRRQNDRRSDERSTDRREEQRREDVRRDDLREVDRRRVEDDVLRRDRERRR